MDDQRDHVPRTPDSDLGELPPSASEGDTLGAEAVAQASHSRRVRALENASLILAILSCPLFLFAVLYVLDLLRQWGLPVVGQLFPRHSPPWLGLLIVVLFVAPAAIVTGHIAIAKGRRDPRARGVRWRPLAGTLIGYLNVIVPILLVTFAYFNKGRPNSDMASCQGNLKRIEVVLQKYSRENRGMFPPLSSQPGVIMFSPEAIPPESFTDRLPFTCPTIRYARKPTAGRNASDRPASAYDDLSYFYLGYAVLDDDDVEAFAKAYRKQIAEGGTFDDDLVVEDGAGTRVLHRLSEDVKEIWRATHDPHAISPYEGREAYYDVPGVVTADVPLVIERDLGHVYTDWDGRPRGAHVLYLNAGVQFVERGTWPITEKTQRILAELAE